jgi:hypothetical protein
MFLSQVCKPTFMNRMLPLLIISVIFSSCLPMVSYVGNTQQVTAKVDVYVDPAAIRKPYSIVGKGYLNYALNTMPHATYESMQRSAISQAKKHGADAVLFLSREYFNNQTGINTRNTYDTAGLKTASSTIIGPVIQNKEEILFLKYE